MFPIFLFGQYTSIPDSMFEQRLIDFGYDTIYDGQVLTADIVNIDTLILENPHIQGTFSFTYGPISDLTGIEDFSNLTYLDCSGGNQIDTLDLSQNPTLTYLNCSGDGWIFKQILSLNISQNTALSHLNCNSTLLSQLDLSQNPNLTFLDCMDTELQILDLSHNIGLLNLDCSHSILLQTLFAGNPVTHLTNLDFSQNINLTSINCYGNALSSLDLSQNINLTSLNCADNQLQILDLSQNIGLVNLDCGNNMWGDFDNTNQLTNLDLSQNINLTSINCYGNALSNLDLRNGNNTNIGYFNSGNNDSLFCISVDDSTWSVNNWTDIDSHTSFSNDCNPSTVDIIEIEKNLSVYPNPTSEEITISINNFNGNIQTEVYDLIGNKLQTTNKTTISLSDYARGIYLLKVAYGDRVEEVKVIKD